ncbi:Pilus assembly protein, PilP [bacterium BMS3Abin12]|nr:Pilus assembly protein, PilP [bacterium BMS3Abin12]
MSAGARTVRSRGVVLLAALAAAILLGGCGGDRMSDLHQWVRRVEARPGGRISPLPKVKSYRKFTYSAFDLRDPFSPSRLGGASKVKVNGNSKLRPNAKRPRGPLEAFPLDTLRMVGTLDKGGRVWALVRAPDGTIYPVHDGDYMGRNYGKVVKITEGRLGLVEIVSDGMGGWMKRPASLALK